MQNALIIDDNEDNRDIVRAILEGEALTVYEVDGGTAGLAFLATQTVDLVILDLEMPDLNGTKVLSEMRETPGLQEIPVIVVTANHHMVETTVEDMADFVCLKPIDIPQLRQFVNRLR